jgi:low affinity Fe/Cu permease
VLEEVRRGLTQVGVHEAHPLAFIIVKRAEHRDTQAIQAKLDELLHAQARARNKLTHIDEEEPEDIARHRKEARRND